MAWRLDEAEARLRGYKELPPREKEALSIYSGFILQTPSCGELEVSPMELT